jgi:hypothetical protein
MAKPKDEGKNPMKRGIKFVKRANMWCYYEVFNKLNTSDKVEWFNTKEGAKERMEKVCLNTE